MADEIKILDRGKLELKNSYIKCFLGNNNNYIVSEEIYKELKSNESSDIYDTHTINNIDYTIYYPIPEKKYQLLQMVEKYINQLYILLMILKI